MVPVTHLLVAGRYISSVRGREEGGGREGKSQIQKDEKRNSHCHFAYKNRFIKVPLNIFKINSTSRLLYRTSLKNNSFKVYCTF